MTKYTDFIYKLDGSEIENVSNPRVNFLNIKKKKYDKLTSNTVYLLLMSLYTITNINLKKNCLKEFFYTILVFL